MMSMPSIMKGACIITRYKLNETMEATGRFSWMTIHPPTSRTRTSPTWERFCTSGANRARRSASLMYAHCTRSAALASWRSCCCSAAKLRTTRTPFTFSSTTVATSARRDWMSHETGKRDFRILTPTT